MQTSCIEPPLLQSEGVWFRFSLRENIIEVWFWAVPGITKVYCDGMLVSRINNHRRGSRHFIPYLNDQLEVTLSRGEVGSSQLRCDLHFKDDLLASQKTCLRQPAINNRWLWVFATVFLTCLVQGLSNCSWLLLLSGLASTFMFLLDNPLCKLQLEVVSLSDNSEHFLC